MVGFFASGIWKKAPFVRLLIPVIAGILIQDIFPISKWVSITVIAWGLIAQAFFLMCSPLLVFRLPALSGFLLHLLLAAIGCQILVVSGDFPLIKRSSQNQVNLIVEVKDSPERKNGTVSCQVFVHWRIKNGICYRENERLLVYFTDSGHSPGWVPGSQRLLQGRLSPIRNRNAARSAGAGRFDYVVWCERRHIHSRVFIRSADGYLLRSAPAFNVRNWLVQTQKKLRLICRRYVPDAKQGGLLEALLIGYTRDLDPEVLRDYSNAGVVHIIAISGLHLALIGELMQLLLMRLGQSRGMKLVRLLLLLTVIWGYSLLTGASPSVLRSAVMFSFVLLAKHFCLRAPVLNALAASAFLLLCEDPYRLWDTGFQLSYAAVLGLVLFASPVQGWVRPANKGLQALWKASSVSLAAQVLTTPISIWYFHRFPFYFLLTNLVSVPLSSAILLGGIGLLLLSGLPSLAWLPGRLLDAALQIMNFFVAFTNRLPGSAASAIPIQPFQVVLCYSMLYSGCRFAEKGNKTWLLALLIQLCLFFAGGLNN